MSERTDREFVEAVTRWRAEDAPRSSASNSTALLGRDLTTENDEMAGLQMKYFVLKPSGDDAYAKASRAAMRAYAIRIMEENPELARELTDWANTETPALNESEAP